jgi:hypothetical protein
MTGSGQPIQLPGKLLFYCGDFGIRPTSLDIHDGIPTLNQKRSPSTVLVSHTTDNTARNTVKRLFLQIHWVKRAVWTNQLNQLRFGPLALIVKLLLDCFPRLPADD